MNTRRGYLLICLSRQQIISQHSSMMTMIMMMMMMKMITIIMTMKWWWRSKPTSACVRDSLPACLSHSSLCPRPSHPLLFFVSNFGIFCPFVFFVCFMFFLSLPSLFAFQILWFSNLFILFVCIQYVPWRNVQSQKSLQKKAPCFSLFFSSTSLQHVSSNKSTLFLSSLIVDTSS